MCAGGAGSTSRIEHERAERGECFVSAGNARVAGYFRRCFQQLVEAFVGERGSTQLVVAASAAPPVIAVSSFGIN